MASPHPPFTTPAELAAHYGLSERAVCDKVRELGAFRKVGAKVIMLAADVEYFWEAVKPCKSTSAGKSTTTGAPLPVGGYEEARERLTAKPRKGSRRKSKGPRGEVISMDRGRT